MSISPLKTKIFFALILSFLFINNASAGTSPNVKVTEITINASPEKVWSILMDFENHINWNPFIKKISGEKSVGGKLSITVQSPGKDPMDFEPIVLILEENKHLRWKGKFLFEGLFDGEHFFMLKDNQDGTTTFTHGEIFSGVLVRFFSEDLNKTEQGFKLMNEALKKECEKI